MGLENRLASATWVRIPSSPLKITALDGNLERFFLSKRSQQTGICGGTDYEGKNLA